MTNIKKINPLARCSRFNFSDSFWLAYSEYSSLTKLDHDPNDRKNMQYWIHLITDKKYSIKETSATYRTINHWAKIGIFEDSRSENKTGWRKFSVVDLVWLGVIAELKKFGFSLEKIKVGYDGLMTKSKIIEFAVMSAFFRETSYFIAFEDGTIEYASRDEIAQSESFGLLLDKSYIVINVNNCLNQIFPKAKFLPKNNFFQLTDKEVSVLSKIRLSDFDEISITKRNGDIENINVKKNHLSDIPKIADMLNKLAFGEFKIKKQNGKIVFIEEIEKNKV